MTSHATTATTPKKGALKGAVAAAAGAVVLLGGAGTFALWNANGEIGTGSTGTGQLTAEFGETTWTDTTPGASNEIADVSSFQMVPGDTIEGSSTVHVVAEGENLKVDTGLDYADGTLPEGVTADVALTDADGNEVTQLDEGTYDLTTDVTLAFDPEATGSMSQAIDLSAISIDLQQVLNS